VAAVVTKCQKRISGPLLDRIDIQIEAPRVDYEKLLGGGQVGEIRQFCELQDEGQSSMRVQKYPKYSVNRSQKPNNKAAASIAETLRFKLCLNS
jgi:predicted ATPase with chaperone activity